MIEKEPTTTINGIYVFAYHNIDSNNWVLGSHDTGTALMTGTKSEVMKEYHRLEEEGKIKNQRKN